MDKSNIEVFILAGGKSRRMGTDKGLVNFKGKPMIQHVLDLLDELDLKTNIVTSNKNYIKFGKSVYHDIIPDKGPLGGLYTAVNYSQAPMVMLLACDMPSINRMGIHSLLAIADKETITVATDGKQLSPLFACYPITINNKIEEAFLTDKLKMQDFIAKQPHELLDLDALSNTEVLKNLNTMKDLIAAENDHKPQRQINENSGSSG